MRTTKRYDHLTCCGQYEELNNLFDGLEQHWMGVFEPYRRTDLATNKEGVQNGVVISFGWNS